MDTSTYDEIRQAVVDWLDDNYHFGDAESIIGDDDRSFLKNGVLDSLGFVQLILFLEGTYALKIDRKSLRPSNFDGLRKIVSYVMNHPGFRR